MEISCASARKKLHTAKQLLRFEKAKNERVSFPAALLIKA
jgi:hypothetical protein